MNVLGALSSLNRFFFVGLLAELETDGNRDWLAHARFRLNPRIRLAMRPQNA